MTLPIVEAKSVSKSFSLHHGGGGLKRSFVNIFNPRCRERIENFQALSEVSFSLQRGESLALLGHNGSGKSTLLQLLAGILQPTSGIIHCRGRIAPLIELGVGFHHELTGEENIYLNASLFGLSNREIRSRINDIIDFSGLGDFIDTPVKHYSSGMYMRLGFSVAVHVEPDVLLADEILAVGDIEFRNKCHARIRDMQSSGMALILVTHSPEEGRLFCKRFLRLDHGKVVESGFF